jgi:hypothetical protein
MAQAFLQERAVLRPAHLATGDRKLTMLRAPAAPHVANDGNVEWGIREGHPRLPACHQPIDVTSRSGVTVQQSMGAQTPEVAVSGAH